MNANIIAHKTYADVETEEYNQDGWNFIFTKASMFNTTDLDMLQDALTLQGIPDITNGNNTGLLYNKQHNFGFYVNTKDALHLCNFKARENNFLDLKKLHKTDKVNHTSTIPTQAQLKMAAEWKDKKHNDIKILERISDTFYSTPYKGTIVEAQQINYQFQRFKDVKAFQGKSIFETQLNEQILKSEKDYLNSVFNQQQLNGFYCEFTEEEIPVNNLGADNPIKWACHISLYEDELGDNGLSNCEFRFRVMGDCFFGLIRSYLRIDDVLIRLLDTRIYHDFKTDFILRDFTHREEKWDQIKKSFQFSPQWSVDPNQSFMIQSYVTIQENVKDKIYFKKGD